MKPSEADKNKVPEIRALTEEGVNEQIKSFIAPLPRQLDDMTWLLQGVTAALYPNYYPRADTNASYNFEFILPSNCVI